MRYIDDNLVAVEKNSLDDFSLGGANFRSSGVSRPSAVNFRPTTEISAAYVDMHCHCLAGVDDGPVTMSETLALCRALTDDGISTVAATPHQLGRFDDCNEAAHIREKVAVLNKELKSKDIPLTVMPGADIRVDERICQLLEDDKILTLADGGRYILMELPHEVFIDIEPLLVELSSLGIEAIISHPERHPVLSKRDEMLLKWLNQSAYLQVTAGSLLGEFGPAVQKTAWHFLSSGWAWLVATDSHNLNDRRPCMKAAFERISIELGEDIARLVCIENPLRVLEGRDVAAVCPVRNRRLTSNGVYATNITEYSNDRARNSY